jgi:hypothetical protein
MHVMPSHGASSILERTLIPPLDELKPAAAKAVLQMKFSRRDRRRINELSALARQGTLSEAQADELDFYLNLGSILTILHSKARVALKRRSDNGAAHNRARRKSA